VSIGFLATFVLALLSSFVATYFVRALANAKGWVAAPNEGRHIHRSPVPRLGGVAIFTAFVLCMAVIYAASLHVASLHARLPGNRLLTILVAASIVFSLGVYDDIRGARPYTKFAVQALAAIMLFAGGLRITNIPVLFGDRTLPWLLGLLCTVVWVLAITNAFNLIDGLDGLATGSALFSTLVAFIVGLQNGSLMVSFMTIALAGAMVGFLRYNFNPATIFLGDSGSLFIGFLLSAIALQGAQKSPTIVAVAIPVVSFGLPVLETSLSVIRRIISGRPIFTADRDHIHHKLLEHGLSHRQVVVLLYGVSAAFAMLSLFMLWPGGSSLALVLAVLGTGVWIGVQRLGYVEFGELARVAQRTLDQREILINNLAFRRATESFKTAASYDQVRRILLAAFEDNDFDGFDLLPPDQMRDFSDFETSDNGSSTQTPNAFYWRKPGMPIDVSDLPLWTLSIDLISTTSKVQGTLRTERLYSNRPIQLDINLLTKNFPMALADALERTVRQTAPVLVMPGEESDRIFPRQNRIS
jgi:UDP-GlcNAc:undecaprenyl-phosphate GlcNAc-1-phosphate transferase